MKLFNCLGIDFLFSRRLDEKQTRGKKRRALKMFAFVQRFFAETRIRLIRLNIFVERVNRVEKSHVDWANWHILEQMNREEKKDKTVSFQSTNKGSMTGAK